MRVLKNPISIFIKLGDYESVSMICEAKGFVPITFISFDADFVPSFVFSKVESSWQYIHSIQCYCFGQWIHLRCIMH